MIEAFLSNPYFAFGAILLACFGGYIRYRIAQKTRLALAAAAFRAAIDPAIFYGLHGNSLHGALIKQFPAHCAAAHEFRRYIGPIDRWRFRKAWEAYHGGTEEYPDFLPYYIGKKEGFDFGHELLINRINALRNAASQT